MKVLAIIIGLLSVFIILPVQFYLQYQVLARVNATELMWFLFWVNLPLIVLMQIVNKLVEKAK